MPSSDVIMVQSGIIDSGTARKTVLQWAAPAEYDMEVFEIYTTGRAAPSSTSHLGLFWEVALQTSAGTGGDAVTEQVWPNASAASGVGTALTEASATWTAEPTTGVTYNSWITPATPPGYTWRGSILIPASTRLGILVTSGDSTNCLARMLGRRA